MEQKIICECKFNRLCHLPRQNLQELFRKRDLNITVNDCDFYSLHVKYSEKS